MKRYSFIYGKSYENKRIAELINYLEEEYRLEYLESIDINSIFSFNIKVLNIVPSKKEIIFKSNKKIEEVEKCKSCNFPVEFEDLIDMGKSKNYKKVCMNCETQRAIKKGSKWIKK